MRNIKIYEYGDTLFFLDSDGFQKGKVKRTQVISEKGCVEPKITYWLVTESDYSQFQGTEKRQDEVFETYAHMIDHYSLKFKE